MSKDWTAAQEDFLLKARHLTDAEMAEHLSAIGPVRTRHGVAKKRRRLCIRRRKSPVGKVAKLAVPEVVRVPEPETLTGFCRARDAAYVRACLLGLAEIHGLKVAA